MQQSTITYDNIHARNVTASFITTGSLNVTSDVIFDSITVLSDLNIQGDII